MLEGVPPVRQISIQREMGTFDVGKWKMISEGRSPVGKQLCFLLEEREQVSVSFPDSSLVLTSYLLMLCVSIDGGFVVA